MMVRITQIVFVFAGVFKQCLEQARQTWVNLRSLHRLLVVHMVVTELFPSM